MKELIKKYWAQTEEKIVDYFFNHVLALTSILGVAGFIIHIWYPQHRAEFDTFVSTYLIHQRKNDA